MDVPVRTTAPRVTKRELAAEYPRFIAIDRSRFKLRLYEDLKLAKA